MTTTSAGHARIYRSSFHNCLIGFRYSFLAIQLVMPRTPPSANNAYAGVKHETLSRITKINPITARKTKPSNGRLYCVLMLLFFLCMIFCNKGWIRANIIIIPAAKYPHEFVLPIITSHASAPDKTRRIIVSLFPTYWLCQKCPLLIATEPVVDKNSLSLSERFDS